jgi:hypothetical protein
VPVVVEGSLESVEVEVAVAVAVAVAVVSVKNEDALVPSVALASEEVDSVTLPSVVASVGAGDVAVSDVVMMLLSGPTSASADETQTATTKSATSALTSFAV